MSSIKTSDVTSFIKDMIEMTMVFEVDEAGYVIQKQSGDRVMISDGSNQCPLIIYQEEIQDNTAQIINPLAEGLGSTPSSLWFFNVQKTALLGRIYTLFVSIIKKALDEKKTKADKNNHIPMEILNIAAKIIDNVDEKLLDELMSLMDNTESNELITIYYQRKQLRSVLRSSLFDEEETGGIPTWKSKFPKIRRKTWPTLETIMLSILNISDKDDMSKFTKKADVISCARFSSFLNVLTQVYQEINPLLDAINPDVAIDLSKLAYHLSRLSSYTDNAKFMVQPSRASITPQPQTLIPGTIPSTTIPGYPQIPNSVPQPGVTLIPGPMYADGRMGAPIPVSQFSGYPQPQQQMGIPAGFTGGYMPPQQMPYGFGGQQQPYGGIPPNIPFDGPYITQPNYNMSGGMGNINLLPPGAPGGFNPNYR